MERVKADLDRHTQEQSRLETEQRTFNEVKEALSLELRRLRENEAAHQADVAEMEGRLAENIALLAHTTSELEIERGERQRLEQRAGSLVANLQDLHEELKRHLESEQANEHRIASLMQQLHEREDAVTRVSLSRRAAEEQLRTTADLGSQLQNHLSLLEEAKQVFASREQDLASRLQASLNALRERESCIEKEAGERRRLEEARSGKTWKPRSSTRATHRLTLAASAPRW
jgi:hypothetical protein